MARYRFLTTWLLEGPRQRAWDTLADVLAWPEWWDGVEAVAELAPGDGRRVGSHYRVRWRAPTHYGVELEFLVTAVDEPTSMTGIASGQLKGTGTWRLFEQQGVTAVLYEWDVRTAGLWTNLLAPFARPLFTRSHDALMRAGGEGLARRLECRLLAT